MDESKNELKQEANSSESKNIDNTDWFLEMLVEMQNGTDGYVGITLNVGGMLLTGDLISGHKYFEWFADSFTKGVVKGEDSQKIREVLASLGDIYTKDKKVDKTKPPVYIHIKDAKFFQPGGNDSIPTSENTWWRGRISAVDGFILGKITVEKK